MGALERDWVFFSSKPMGSKSSLALMNLARKEKSSGALVTGADIEVILPF